MASRRRKKPAIAGRPGPTPDDPGRKTGGQRHLTIGALGLLALLALLAFANSLVNEFAYDDESIVVENRLIKSLTHLPRLFISDYWASTLGAEFGGNIYRPLMMASFALNYAVGGLEPLGYHLVNLFLHIVVSWMLYALGRQLRLSRGAALAAAAIFAVHPLHAEAVTGIVGRAELLMALGILTALVCYERGRTSPNLVPTALLASWAAFALALLSKEQAMVLPALLVLTDLSLLSLTAAGEGVSSWQAIPKNIGRRYLGHLLILGAYLGLRAVALNAPLFKSAHRVALLDNPLAHVPWDLRVLTALKVAGRYLWLMAWPVKLSADYSYNAIPIATSPLDSQVVLSGLVWGGILVLGVYAYFKGLRAMFIGIGLMILTFLPASNLLIPIGTVMGERLFYLPSAGLCLLLGGGWDRLTAWADRLELRRAFGKAGLGALAVVVLLLTLRTAQRNQDWRNTETLMQSAVQIVPQSARVHSFLAGSLIRARQWDEAIEHLNRAVGVLPDYVSAHLRLGVALHGKGRWQDAEATLQRALAIAEKAGGPEHPNVADSLNELAVLYAAQARAVGILLPSAEKDQTESLRQKALALNQRALAIRERVLGPEHPFVAESLDHLASIYMDQRKFREAEAFFLRALAIRETALGRQHRLVAESLEHLAALLRATNRAADAAHVEGRASAIRAKIAHRTS